MDPLHPPKGVHRWNFCWPVAITLLGIHILALAATFSWLFSWSGLILCAAGLYIFGTLGINVGYHRLLTHRSFACSRLLERALTIIGFCNLQGSSVRWVAAHRMHHQYSDSRPDPHTPLVDFIWGHVGWLLVTNPGFDTVAAIGQYAADLCRDSFHLRLHQNFAWMWIWLAHVVIIYTAGMAIGWGLGGNVMASVQLGLSWIVWAVLVRTILVWHITWAINSVTHLWGYRNFNTPDNSRNNWLLGYVGMGEGWHNNHHSDRRCAAHGLRWWELDVTYVTIRLLEFLKLASHVMRPSRRPPHANSLRKI